MNRTSRIVRTAVAAMVLAALAVPAVSTAAGHHDSTAATGASSGSVAAIGWPGDDVKPGHDPS